MGAIAVTMRYCCLATICFLQYSVKFIRTFIALTKLLAVLCPTRSLVNCCCIVRKRIQSWSIRGVSEESCCYTDEQPRLLVTVRSSSCEFRLTGRDILYERCECVCLLRPFTWIKGLWSSIWQQFCCGPASVHYSSWWFGHNFFKILFVCSFAYLL